MDTKTCTLCGITLDATPKNFFRKVHGKFGLSSRCKKCDYERKLVWKNANRDRVNECARKVRYSNIDKSHKYQSDYRKRVLYEVKKQVFNAYGHKCSCCGEDKYEFLSIDHVDGSGSNHRKKTGKTSSFRTVNMYKDIIKKGFPDNIRILCYNCHFSVDFHGYCPHGNIRREYNRGKQAKSIWDVSEKVYQVPKTGSSDT